MSLQSVRTRDGLLPVLLAAPLKHVAEGVQQDVVALVPAVGLVAQEHGGPLDVGHGGGAGVGEHIHGQHAGREGKFVVVGGFQGALPLLHGDLGDVPGHVGQAAGCFDGKLVLVAHWDSPFSVFAYWCSSIPVAQVCAAAGAVDGSAEKSGGTNDPHRGICATVSSLRDSPRQSAGCTYGVRPGAHFAVFRPDPILLPESFCVPLRRR